MVRPCRPNRGGTGVPYRARAPAAPGHELAEGAAYVADHDGEARPVMVFRIKQYYPTFHSQKSYLRLLAFTLEISGLIPS
ncbi:hypothetical protein Taro_033504 [Colocasia esculenta]|uniref:Uncharacterized protein n=1 Tax=Colocasia esculenta TaxID=4460 RepID=A0A843VY36_COLES|nr:hypothetical protein [Colocasia esculenta]